MGAVTLAKRTAGQPLSDAERTQRQNAAKSRWAAAKAVAGAAGAVLGASVAQGAIQQRHARVLQAILQASDEALQPEETRHAAKDARILLNGLRAKAKVNGSWPVPAMRAALYQQKRDATKELKAAQAEIDPYEEHRRLVMESLRDEPAADFETSIGIRQDIRERNRNAKPETIADASRPARDIAAVQGRIDELADARKTTTVPRDGRTYTLTPHTRRIKVGRELREKYHNLMGEARASAEEAGEEFHPPKHWFRTTYKTVEVKPKNKTAETAAHRVRVKGTPDTKKIRSIRAELTGRIESFTNLHREAEELRHAANLKSIGAELAPKLSAALHWLPSRRFRLAALAGGAAAGAAAGIAATQATQQLAKAAGDENSADADTAFTPLPDAPAQLNAAVEAGEPKLAEALAGVFRQWKDDAAANLLTPRESTLYSTMLTDMERASRPLDTILKAGGNAPVTATVPTDTGGSKIITLTMGARGPDVERYIADYRQSRIVELAQEQKEAIRDLLIQAAQEGSSPQEMARRIRQTIGLTATQAQSVLNYRRELEQNKPGALTRALRDQRYDGLVQRNLDENGQLTTAQIDRLTDAYHRKFLAYRAMTIARTEGVGAANNGHIATVRATLAKSPRFTVIKTWHATIDGRERHDHHELNNTSVIGLDTPFICASGDQIKWPHDPAAAARQVIKCRCYVSLHVVPRDVAAKQGVNAVKTPLA
jgi:hypothetical protein